MSVVGYTLVKFNNCVEEERYSVGLVMGEEPSHLIFEDPTGCKGVHK
ncbi:hypothetical protein J7L60_03840 [Candidatus Bathyarchaeota archaeon]|nr:hypothetical protein [Candidatus Bathyarchaeota archaeon]